MPHPTVKFPQRNRTENPSLRDVGHAGFTVVGDKRLKLFTVHVVDKGKPLYVYRP